MASDISTFLPQIDSSQSTTGSAFPSDDVEEKSKQIMIVIVVGAALGGMLVLILVVFFSFLVYRTRPRLFFSWRTRASSKGQVIGDDDVFFENSRVRVTLDEQDMNIAVQPFTLTANSGDPRGSGASL